MHVHLDTLFDSGCDSTVMIKGEIQEKGENQSRKKWQGEGDSIRRPEEGEGREE